ncbi:hypothetical protein Pint_07560 [Pistacia integerrima]|uniref:Uncharacterized protein n=1 Tax=Pistacia integerrima TaxID=434235 RepID=A0ACC0XUH5_9ROSI|nr:hypothetical protein Pint_07560 [Pistacia integerrima]
MEKVSVVVRFDGTWTTSAGRYAYDGGRTTGMRVEKGIAYECFVEDLRRTVNEKSMLWSLEIKVLLPCINMSAPPMRICDYPTLCFFLDNAGGPATGFIPLCITKHAIIPRDLCAKKNKNEPTG